MDKKLRRFLPAVFLALGLAAWAEDPWKDKPPAEWSKKDAQKILEDSPWTQVVSAKTLWARPGGEKLESGSGPSQIGAVTINPDRSDQEGRFLVRWESSWAVRQALKRDAHLRNTYPPKHADNYTPENYVVVVVWDPFVLHFPKAKELEVHESALIEPALLDEEVRAVRAEYRRGSNGRVEEVAFFFPKQTREGREVIRENEQRVDFVWHIGAGRIPARFNLKKMVARGVQDLD